MPQKGKARSSKGLKAQVTFAVENERHFKRYIKYLSNPLHIVWRNFLAGTFHGVGFILGTAIFFWLLSVTVSSLLGSVPFFSDIAQALDIWLETTLESR